MGTALCAALFAPESTNPLLTPWLHFDPLSHLFTFFFLGIGLGVALLSHSFFNRFKASQGEYYFLLIASIFGLILIGTSADFLTLFLGIETLSLSLYVLCCFMKAWEISHEAAFKYFLTGALAASFLVYGIALLYGALGTTHFDALLPAYKSLTTSSSYALFFGGLAFITLGLSFEAALFPFHLWAPDAYGGAPTPVTALMAIGTKVGAIAAFIRVFFMALPQTHIAWNFIFIALALTTLVYANLVALRQVQLRRFFAYSGISHAGFLLLPFVAPSADAIPALLFYLLVYAIATLGAFGVLAVLDHDENGVVIDDLKGLFHSSPWLAILLALCLLTLAGLPPTAGFFAKFYLFKVVFQAGYPWLVGIGLVITLLSAYYYMRLVSIMLAKPRSSLAPLPLSWPVFLVGAFSLLALLTLSVFPDALLETAK